MELTVKCELSTRKVLDMTSGSDTTWNLEWRALAAWKYLLAKTSKLACIAARSLSTADAGATRYDEYYAFSLSVKTVRKSVKNVQTENTSMEQNAAPQGPEHYACSPRANRDVGSLSIRGRRPVRADTL
ncbi:uncharacterized protein MYCGRDRAFT_91663 [Zymoseptoria tritici IPO323]|uniref:Uncharacterized protein n=1 Tax=Zymoseptoria tritici (strain CBS 115943 / IPO323) TaxID=336722 RepID=F9X7T3_ZYMTI|nr:uncharacterized protein MYCGRDRAFT_91663 [Zymoseptoria tritici IPO323]EGP89427.1 hypothetical protein MYCGRDRAFT_91663 [Zymoseptoria tritici IPO323]